MIGTIDIHCNAANPNVPLKALFAFVDSPSSLRIIDVPKKIGKWNITQVMISATYPDNRIVSAACVLTGGCWTGTIAGSTAVGKSLNGYVVSASGTDENGDQIDGYILGKGDVCILDADGRTVIDGKVTYLHLLDETPDEPKEGDVIFDDDKWMIYQNDNWKSIGSTIKNINTNQEINLEIEKLSQDEYYRRVDDDELIDNRLYVTSSDYTTGFFKRIIEVADPEMYDDAANKKYVDANIDKCQPKGDYLSSSTFIPTKTSELSNDSDFKDGTWITDNYNDKSEIQEIIRFDITTVTSDDEDKITLKDRTYNIIAEYGNETIYLPIKKSGKSRHFALSLSSDDLNTIISNQKWRFANYIYDTAEDPLTTSCDTDGVVELNFYDITEDKIKIDRSKLSKGEYTIPYDGLKVTNIGNDMAKISLTKNKDVSTLYASVEYSSDNETWYPMTITAVNNWVEIPAGKYIYLRAADGVTNRLVQRPNYEEQIIFVTDNVSQLKVSGRLISIINNTLTVKPEYEGCYRKFFSGCKNIVDASKLIIEYVGNSACSQLFYGCTSLIYAPEILAETPTNNCYNGMFYGCTSLTIAPELPATNLADSCYSSMFQSCTALAQAPELPATTLAGSCYNSMFRDCTALIQAPALPATTLAQYCYSYMFSNCVSLTTAPVMPATNLATNCYTSMYNGCTSLTIAPELPATNLADSCYSSMFQNCTSLTIASELPATTLVNGCYRNMFSGCTSLTTAPELPATTLVTNCYYRMFYGCISLSSIDINFTEWDNGQATNNWVNGVAASGTFTKPSALPDTRGTAYIPNNWTIINK